MEHVVVRYFLLSEQEMNPYQMFGRCKLPAL